MAAKSCKALAVVSVAGALGESSLNDDDVLGLIRQSHEALIAQPAWSVKKVPRVTEPALEASEKELGFALPRFLRRLYLEVANGVVLPAFNTIAGVRGGLRLEDDEAIDRYLSWRNPPDDFAHWRWPIGVVPITHWGCAVYSCIDCAAPGAPVFSFEAAAYQPGVDVRSILVPDAESVESWFASFFASR